MSAEEVTQAGDCTGSKEAASPTPSLIWEGSGHGEEHMLGTAQRYPGGLWEIGKEQVNFLLC